MSATSPDAMRISSETPKTDQWRLLSQYSYASNIVRFLESRGHTNVDRLTVNFVAGCIEQGRAYFTAAEHAPLDIAPLLLYYGSTNLLAGVGAMLVGSRLTIHGHGMRLQNTTSPLADISIMPLDPSTGALQQFSNVFSGGCLLTNGAEWELGEIFGSIPDLRIEYDAQYQNRLPYVVPVEVVHTRHGILERILPADIQRLSDPLASLTAIPGYSACYLAPQYTRQRKYLVLRHKLDTGNIGVYALTGQKFLQLPHSKNGQRLIPDQVIMMFMALFALGYLSRYHPEVWHPFVRRDETGERLVVEKFLAIVSRFLPNLMLDAINGYRIQFTNQPQGTTDLTAFLTEDEVQRVVQHMLNRRIP